jgi:hypothetical protein
MEEEGNFGIKVQQVAKGPSIRSVTPVIDGSLTPQHECEETEYGPT